MSKKGGGIKIKVEHLTSLSTAIISLVCLYTLAPFLSDVGIDKCISLHSLTLVSQPNWQSSKGKVYSEPYFFVVYGFWMHINKYNEKHLHIYQEL